MLNTGDKSPSFSLKNQENETVSLQDFKGKKVLVWFFPKASTPGWTVQGQGLRDEFQKFQDNDVEILGMSADSVKAQKSFCDKQEFPFSLLSDPSKETIKTYGAWGPKKFMGREYEGIHRYSYLIDEKGIVERTYPKVKTKTFAQDVLADIR